MSATRRQSGRLAKLALSPQTEDGAKISSKSAASPVKSKRETSQDDLLSEDSEEESEPESDYEKRPAKRQKLKKAPSTNVRKGARKSAANKTCYITELPLDVLKEIFSHLGGPKDLIMLSRTNHLFRDHLLSKEVASVWRVARENADGPDPPSDLSEQRWAHLLYAEARCQSCNANNIQRVDFGLRRRACTKCLKANLVVTSSFKRHFPELEKTILDLIPYTNIGGFAHGHASSSNFYWKPDIEEMIGKLAVLDSDVHRRVPGARKKLEDFTAERIAFVETVVNHAAICRDWSRILATRRGEENRSKLQQRYTAIEHRFKQLGYTAKDISGIRYQNSVNQAAPLTDRIWKKIFPVLEPIVQEYKEKRLKAEKEGRVRARSRLAQTVYNDYKKTLSPSQWRYLPGLYDILQLPAFDTVVDSPIEMTIEATHFKEALDHLPGFIVSWIPARKTELVQLIEKAQIAADPGPSGAPSPAKVYSNQSVSLDLATAVFTCGRRCQYPGRPSLIGWDGAAGHTCHQSRYAWSYGGDAEATSVETILEFSSPGSVAAASLIKLTGLDEKRATCADMDKRDLRVLCMTCPPKNGPNHRQSFPILSWRAAVAHFMSAHSSTPTPMWQLLDTAETQKARADEGPDPTLSWTCNHCPTYFEDCQKFADVVDHVKAIHAIADPKAPTDLVRHLDILPPPIAFLRNAPRELQRNAPLELQYHCRQCTGAKANRIFKLEGVRQHLKALHQVSEPVANRDWCPAKN
ncbi:hypothetical protein C8R43DRAFT_1165696 [Mycena crocata]|nr:hypothetical protein C8R43DRAFT_1165696 [Mycena crocata]